MRTPTTRTLTRVIASQPASDGAGVKLRRSLGGGPSTRLDPFLLLDEFYSDVAEDYIAGFPSHPHRGFETVTYMLDGHMRHEDHLGNRGDLKPGDVQWMTAARGIIHSEMPQQSAGRMRGFQLWLNLPANEKMKPASYHCHCLATQCVRESVRVQAGERGAQLLLLAARPLKEPVVQYGPFVMNTIDEIDQAIDDFHRGRFA